MQGPFRGYSGVVIVYGGHLLIAEANYSLQVLIIDCRDHTKALYK